MDVKHLLIQRWRFFAASSIACFAAKMAAGGKSSGFVDGFLLYAVSAVAFAGYVCSVFQSESILTPFFAATGRSLDSGGTPQVLAKFPPGFLNRMRPDGAAMQFAKSNDLGVLGEQKQRQVVGNIAVTPSFKPGIRKNACSPRRGGRGGPKKVNRGRGIHGPKKRSLINTTLEPVLPRPEITRTITKTVPFKTRMAPSVMRRDPREMERDKLIREKIDRDQKRKEAYYEFERRHEEEQVPYHMLYEEWEDLKAYKATAANKREKVEEKRLYPVANTRYVDLEPKSDQRKKVGKKAKGELEMTTAFPEPEEVRPKPPAGPKRNNLLHGVTQHIVPHSEPDPTLWPQQVMSPEFYGYNSSPSAPLGYDGDPSAPNAGYNYNYSPPQPQAANFHAVNPPMQGYAVVPQDYYYYPVYPEYGQDPFSYQAQGYYQPPAPQPRYQKQESPSSVPLEHSDRSSALFCKIDAGPRKQQDGILEKVAKSMKLPLLGLVAAAATYGTANCAGQFFRDKGIPGQDRRPCLTRWQEMVGQRVGRWLDAVYFNRNDRHDFSRDLGNEDGAISIKGGDVLNKQPSSPSGVIKHVVEGKPVYYYPENTKK